MTATAERHFDSTNGNLGETITMMMTHGEGPNPSDGPPNRKDAVLHERMQRLSLRGRTMPIRVKTERVDHARLDRG
jgi:hypothetical protein